MSVEVKPKRPDYMKSRRGSGPVFSQVIRKIRALGLHTVCEEAKCPNLAECWGDRTATIMILGDVCTRNCRFCSVKTGNPHGVLDRDEPVKVARAIKAWGLKYAVITSVDRDDLPDKGSGHYAEVIKTIKKENPDVLVEALIPDYLGDDLKVVLDAGTDCLGHNIEVVQRITPKVRDRRASYQRSLEVLKEAKAINPEVVTKSSIMVGLGETYKDLEEAFKDLAAVDLDILTIGQYLRPTSKQLPVVRYYEESEFEVLKDMAIKAGIKRVVSGPLVRSSYRAAQVYASLKDKV